ncbi:dienelactone hydrolase family protein [Teredinibacter waterburyi]|uniref:dienelactone hydrolase family protein n=1 Tax=Teredinibacter waterburyi TaxID=1500538 RepID=UPI001CAA8A18|nr:dienelactone hydrolase family protein [Teredinibacter waterburyi]
MKVLKYLVLIAVVAGAVVYGIAYLLPSNSHVERSTTVAATPERTFEFVADHQAQSRWSPWLARDPEMSRSLSGPNRGLGSKLKWQSDVPEVGSGTSEVIEYVADRRVSMRLVFDNMSTGGTGTITLEPSGAGTLVTWSFDMVHTGLLSRYSGLMMDSWVGADYEAGLQKLEKLINALPKISSKVVTYKVGDTTLTGYLAKPAGEGKRPGVIVVHEWWGANDYARKRADMLAELGYNAFALDMYGDGKIATHPKQAQAFMMETISQAGVAAARFDAAVDLLKQEPTTQSNNIAAVGYCFGGAVVISMARSDKPLKGVVSFHGGLSGLAPIVEQRSNQVPLLVLNGAADPFVPDDAKQSFQAEMSASGFEFEFVDYPDAKHAFTNPAADQAGRDFNLPLAYNADADQASWAAMQAFLGRVFN